MVLGLPTDDTDAVGNLNQMALAGGHASGDGVTRSAYASIDEAPGLVSPSAWAARRNRARPRSRPSHPIPPM